MKAKSILENIIYQNGILNSLSKDGINLTKMEILVSSLVFEQYNTKEIADKLKISIRTAENHRNNIRKKFKLQKSESIFIFLIKQVQEIK